MPKFKGTIGRLKINRTVAKHLQEALTWCDESAFDKRHFASIIQASTHDEMVEAVKRVSISILKI